MPRGTPSRRMRKKSMSGLQQMTDTQCQRLRRKGCHKLGPSVVRLNPKESAKVRLEQAEGSRRNGQVLTGRHHVRQDAGQKTGCLQAFEPKGAQWTEEIGFTRQASAKGSCPILYAGPRCRPEESGRKQVSPVRKFDRVRQQGEKRLYARRDGRSQGLRIARRLARSK